MCYLGLGLHDVCELSSKHDSRRGGYVVGFQSLDKPPAVPDDFPGEVVEQTTNGVGDNVTGEPVRWFVVRVFVPDAFMEGLLS